MSTTVETPVLDIAHIVGVAAVEHLVDETVIVGRVVARTELFKPLPVIDKDLFEDIPVPSRFDNHQIAPSPGVGGWGCDIFTTSHPLLPPLIGLHSALPPDSLILELWGLLGLEKCKFLCYQESSSFQSAYKTEFGKFVDCIGKKLLNTWTLRP
jgi:hypothetical protein